MLMQYWSEKGRAGGDPARACLDTFVITSSKFVLPRETTFNHLWLIFLSRKDRYILSFTKEYCDMASIWHMEWLIGEFCWYISQNYLLCGHCWGMTAVIWVSECAPVVGINIIKKFVLNRWRVVDLQDSYSRMLEQSCMDYGLPDNCIEFW